MEVSLKQFVRDVTACGLLSADELASVQKELPATERPQVADLAKRLVRAGKLNKYQASNALQGRAKNLVFGEYVVLDMIGAGGMGQVFKAEHRRMKRIVALKILPPAAVKSPEAVLRFQREVQAAARLEHPNIVPAFDAGEGNGVHFLVMQYVDGQDLSSLAKERGPLPIADAINYITQAARGLAYAHSQGMVHRDIKPANLLLDKLGVVKILDMGLARFDDDAQRTEAGLTASGEVMGTVDYMAPEQAENTHQVDHRADIYSLGCSLYRLLAGENPYRGETVIRTILAHRIQPIPSLRAKRPEVSEALDLVYQRMLAKLPADRFQSMDEVVAALGACQPDHGPADKPTTRPSPLGAAPDGKSIPRTNPSPPPVCRVVASPVVAAETSNQETGPILQTNSVGKTSATLINSATVKKTWSMTAKVISGMFGTIIAPILVAVVLKYFDSPDKPPPDPPAQTANAQGAIASPVASDSTNEAATKATAAADTSDQAKVAKAPASAPAGPITLTDNKPFDLLAVVDTARDAIEGKWTKRAGALQTEHSASHGYSRLQLPVELTDEYDLVLMVSRPKPAPPPSGLAVIFPMGGNQGAIVMDGFRERGWAIERVDGKKPSTSNGTLVTDKPEISAVTSRVMLKVRRGGVEVTCNDELILDWRGRGEQLSLPPFYVIPNKRLIELAAHADFAIHQMTVIPGGSDWTPLFNGRDLKGWSTAEQDRWKTDAEAAVLVGYPAVGKRRQDWLLTDREFRDFRLRLEFQLAKESNGGLGLRSEADTKDSDQLEINLSDDVNGTKRLPTGGIRNLPSGNERDTLPAVPPELHPLGSWNELEVELRGRSLRLWINGRQIQNVELHAPTHPLAPAAVPDLPKKAAKKAAAEAAKKTAAEPAGAIPGLKHVTGRIGLQIDSGHSGQVRYRNIVIHEFK